MPKRQIYFAPIDLVEDRTRTRVVGVGALFIIYLFIGSAFIGDLGDPPYILTEKVTFASALPYYSSLGPNLTLTEAPPVSVQVVATDGNAFIERQCPALGDICDTNSSAKLPVNVTVSIVEIAYPVTPMNAPDCSSQRGDPCVINKGSMPCRMIEMVCTPQLEGTVVTTDETGTATFDSLAIRSGPPANYLLKFDGGDGQYILKEASVLPRVSAIFPQAPKVGTNMRVEPGVPFSKQPRVLLLDEFDRPVPNATVTMFASENLNYFQDFRREADKKSRSDGASLHHPRGQNYALLSGDVSLPSDENGIAVFTDVTLVASSSKYLYLMFYCDGAVASWNSPLLRSPNPGALPRPARYTSPIYVSSPIKQVVALPPGGTGLEAEACVDPDDDNPAPVVVEGDPLPLTPRVRLLDGSGNPVVGQQAIAVLHTFQGNVLPGLARPQMWRLGSSDYGALSKPEPKYLIHALSSPSDADGVANFSDMRFSVYGQDDGTRSMFYSKIAYCTPGSTSPGVYDGCAISCAMQVRTRAAQITWSVQPSYLRSSDTAKDYDNVRPGEPFTTAPIKPVVRFVDAAGEGVPAKLPKAYVWDVDNLKRVCGDEYTDEDFLGEQALVALATMPCVTTYFILIQEFVQLELVTPGSQTALSGAAGFAVAPIAYKLSNQEYMYLASASTDSIGQTVTVMGDAFVRAMSGRIRVVVTDFADAVASLPSQPISFSVPEGVYNVLNAAVNALVAGAQKKEDGRCTALRLDGQFTMRALGRIGELKLPTRSKRPDPYGGKISDSLPLLRNCSVQEAKLSSTVLDSPYTEWGKQCLTLPLGDFDSWMLPIDMPFNYDMSDITFELQKRGSEANDDFKIGPDDFPPDGVDGSVASFHALLFQAITGFSFANCADPTDIPCFETDFDKFFEYKMMNAWFGQDNTFGNAMGGMDWDLPPSFTAANLFPGRELPFPVIKLRAVDAAGRGVSGLRVRLNVFDAIYPNMPPVAKVVTCSLLNPDERGIEIEGMKPNDKAKMMESDQNVCETDKDGYVSMRVKHPLWRKSGEADIEVNMPEFIESASSGTIFYEYSAYRPVYASVNGSSCPCGVPGCGCGALTSLKRACSIDLEMNVESKVASIEWGAPNPYKNGEQRTVTAEQQRTAFNLVTEEGALNENPAPSDDMLAEMRAVPGRAHPASVTLETAEGNFDLMLATDFNAAINGHDFDNFFCFDVKDKDGTGVRNKMLSFDWVHVPSYLAGWSTTLPAECYTIPINDAMETSGCNAKLEDGPQWSMKEYGFNSATDSNIQRAISFPYEPFASMAVMQTGTASWMPDTAAGVGCLIVAMHEGHPGLYGFTMEVDGVRSSPVHFNVKSQLGSIEIVQEPGPTTEGQDVKWYVKSTLEEPPKVRLKKTTGDPLGRYQVFARAVDPDDESTDISDVLFDLADGFGTELQGVFNPIGSARSTPADTATGEALFPNLQLLDAKNGTRFKLKIFFRVTAPYEDEFLADNGVAAKGEVFAVTTTTMVAINPHKLTVSREPSQKVSLGGVLPQTPQMYASIQLKPFQWTFDGSNGQQTLELYKIPEGLGRFGGAGAIVTAALLPVEYHDNTVSPAQSLKYADAFRGSKCSYFAPVPGALDPFAGSCSVIAPKPGSGESLPMVPFGAAVYSGVVVGGVPVAAASAELYGVETGVFAPQTAGRPPYFTLSFDFPEFSWMEGQGSIQAGGMFELPSTLAQEAQARFRKMRVDTQPAAIELLNGLPRNVNVGDSFVLDARVLISSGMQLNGALVCAEVVAAAGPALSPAAFLMNAFNIRQSSLGPDSAQLSQGSHCGLSDEHGYARLILEFISGTEGERVAVQVKASNGVKSDRSNPSTIHTQLNGVDATNQSIDLTGLNGVGKKSKVEQRLSASGHSTSYEAFPIDVPLEDVTIPLNLHPDLVPIKLGGFYQSNFYFRVFTNQGIEKIRARDRLLADASATVDATAGSIEETVTDAAESGLAAGDAAATTATGDAAFAEIKNALTTSGAQMLPSFVQLLVSGSMPQVGGGETALAEVNPTFKVTVSGNSSLKVTDLSITIRKPAEYYIQPVAGGIGGPVIGPFKVEKFDKKNPAAIAVDYALKILTMIVVGLAAVGSSDWHNPKFAVPVGLLCTGALLAIAAAMYPIKSENSIGLWYVITFSVMIAGTLWAALSAVVGAKIKFMRSFADVRKERCFDYCKRFVKQPPSTATRLMENLRLEAEHDLATRLYLTQKLDDELRKERSWKNQITQIFKCVFKEDTAAFYYPTRMYATLVVSVFAMGFWAKSVVGMLFKLAASVRAADVKTITGIRAMLTTLQAQFLKATGNDLPLKATEWALANVEKLHSYIIGLAIAIEVAAVVACVCGILAWVAAWCTMLLDFRSKVMQARRGIWTFNPKKTALKLTFTFFGMQISNGMITFALITFITFIIALILGWNLTYAVIGWVIVNMHGWILGMLIPIVMNTLIKMIMTKYIGAKQVIQKRFTWMMFDLFQLLVSCVTGIVKGLVRFVMVTVVNILSLPRMDVSIFPAWVDYYLMLDSGAKSYFGMVLMYHMHNNPLMRVFCWIVEDDARKRKAGEAGMCSPGYRKASNMFNKLWMMHKNRTLAQYTASGGTVPQSIIAKAAKKKTPEEAKEFLRAEMQKQSEGGGSNKGKSKGPPIQTSSSAIVKAKDVKLETGGGKGGGGK